MKNKLHIQRYMLLCWLRLGLLHYLRRVLRHLPLLTHLPCVFVRYGRFSVGLLSSLHGCMMFLCDQGCLAGAVTAEVRFRFPGPEFGLPEPDHTSVGHTCSVRSPC